MDKNTELAFAALDGVIKRSSSLVQFILAVLMRASLILILWRIGNGHS